MCPNVVFESDVTVPIFKITDNNIKVFRTSDKANGFEGNAFIPDEVRLLLHERMPTHYAALTDAVEQGHTPSVPTPSIPTKQSTNTPTTSVVSQKTTVVREKKSAKSDVSKGQSGLKDFRTKSQLRKKIQGGSQGALSTERHVEIVAQPTPKRKSFSISDSEDDLPISSISQPKSASTKRRRRLVKKSSLEQSTDVQDTDASLNVNPDETSVPDEPIKAHLLCSWQK